MGAQRGWSRAAPREARLGSWGSMGPGQHPLVHKDTRSNNPETERRNTGRCGQHPKVKERTGHALVILPMDLCSHIEWLVLAAPNSSTEMLHPHPVNTRIT